MNEEYLASFVAFPIGEETPDVRHRREWYELQDLERAEAKLKEAREQIERGVAALNLR